MNIKPATIPLTPCQSSTVVGHGYDAETERLAIKFKSGGTYHYAGVPPCVAEELAKAESVGSFVARNVRPIFDGVKQPAEETAVAA